MAKSAMTERCDRSGVLRKTYKNSDCLRHLSVRPAACHLPSRGGLRAAKRPCNNKKIAALSDGTAIF